MITKFITSIRNIKIIYFVLFIIFILLIWSLFSSSRIIYITNIAGQYILHATSLHNGVMPSFIHSRIVFPLILSASFFIGGISLDIVHWTTQLIFSTSLITFFYFSYWLYGKWVALITFVFLCISPKFMLIGSAIDPAYLFPTLILISCMLFVKSNQNNNPWQAVFSGSLISIAIFTKESSWFYSVYPFVTLLLFNKFRSKICLINLFLYYFSLIIILCLGKYVILPNDSNKVLFGELGFRPENVGLVDSSWGIISDIVFKGSIESYLGFSESFVMFPIMFVGILVIIWVGTFKRNYSDKIFMSVLFPITPFIMAFGIYRGGPSFEFRHVIIFVLISHLAMVRVFQIIFQLAANKIDLINKRASFFSLAAKSQKFLVIFFVLIPISFFTYTIIFHKAIYRFDRYGTDIITTGRFKKEVKQASDWIRQNIPKGYRVRVGGKFDHAVIFYTNNEYEYGKNSPKKVDIVFESSNKVQKRENDRIIEINTTNKFRSGVYRYRAPFAVFKSDLNKFFYDLFKEKQWIMRFKEETINFPYIENVLSDYFSKVYELDGVSIYEFTPKEDLDFDELFKNKTKITTKARNDLNWLRKNYPDEYKVIATYLHDYNVKLEN